jgi:hypothetical protein
LSLGPIYAALVAKGGIAQDEHIVIDGWPIQVLPAYKPLVEEALRNSVATTFNKTPTRVFSAEYLCAIALDTGRSKDFVRVSAFIDQEQVNLKELWRIVKKYDLADILKKQVPNWPGVHDDNSQK